VQGALEGALSLVLRHDVDLVCAGRTDRGVHALAQVVHADVDPPEERARAALADLDALRERLDRMVGDAITIWRVRAVGEAFDARFSAVWRAYRYRLASRPADPRLRALVWHVPGGLDVAAMDTAARAVLGEHDYASFCRKAPGRTTMRRVLAAGVTREGDGGEGGEVHVQLRGTAFCHQMVRAITGCLVEVGRGRRPAGWMAEVLAARDRSVAGPVAPPHGLTLEAVGYQDPYEDAPPAGVTGSWAPPHGDRAVPASG
jgi:tRNA pseudouridine38-40 synthase